MRTLFLNIRGIFRILLFLLVIPSYIIFALFIRIFFRNPRRRRIYIKACHFISLFTIWMLRLQLQVKNIPDQDKNYFYVGNHLGIIDIIILAATRPTLFITSVDLRETPGLGLITDAAGCLYVERRRRSNIHNEIEEIRQTLKQGFSIVLFPEGAAMNGEKVQTFKKSLLTAAAGTNIPIKPFCINFRTINGEPMSHKWRDFVFWYGDQSFQNSLWRIFQLSKIEIDLHFFDEIMLHYNEDRRDIAARIQELVESHYTPIPFPLDTKLQI